MINIKNKKIYIICVLSIVFIYILYMNLIYLNNYYIHGRRVKHWNSPELDKKVKNDKNVIIFSSYNYSFYNDPDKKFIRLNKMLLERYSRYHGHVYKQYIHNDKFMSPYWLRVFDLYNLCKTSLENTLIMYVDADATVLKEDISVNYFIDSIDKLYNNNTKDIYISEDPMKEIDLFYHGIFNTGCFIVRNTKNSRRFIKQWLDKYNKSNKWINDNNKWKCMTNLDTECAWSADGYEQGEFSKLYKKNKNVIQWLHWSTLACLDKTNKNCFVLHLMGKKDKYREDTFKQLLIK